MRNWPRITLVLALSVLVAAACGDDSGSSGSDGNFALGENPEISVSNGATQLRHGSVIAVNPGLLDPGQTTVAASLVISNLGNRSLTISGIDVTSGSSDVWRLTASDGAELTLPITLAKRSGAGESSSATVQLHFTRPAGDTAAAGGELVIRSDSVGTNDANRKVLSFIVKAEETKPEIRVDNTLISFGNVAEGQEALKELGIANLGTDPLLLNSFTLTGDVTFAVNAGGVDYPSSATTSQGVTFAEPLVVLPGERLSWPITFSPDGAEEALGELRIFSNDPTVGVEGTPVALEGNVGGPCVTIAPTRVDFGGKLVGIVTQIEVTITSCGDAPLNIAELRLLDDPAYSLDFGLDLGKLPGANPGQASLTTDDAPVVVPAGDSVQFDVTFVPDELNPLDDSGVPVPDLSFIRLVTNTFVPEREVEVRGFGVLVECPTAVIKVQEGEEVIPQTKLHLIGSQSYAAAGSIAKYEWSVVQPPGSQSVFLPSASAPDPIFEANVAGQYVFTLRVWDENGEESCEPDEFGVVVNPDEAIHIELLWDTPADIDQTDEGSDVGADLDLHFLHPFATGLDVDGDGTPDGWFDNPFDTFWYNPDPDWGSSEIEIDDDPGLDRDDTDGAGPENVNLNIPQDGLVYRVGVHYWDDHSFGTSFATVRVYINSVQVFEVPDVELVNHDLWEVCVIAWPSGIVTGVTTDDGGYKLTPNYQHPLFLGN